MSEILKLQRGCPFSSWYPRHFLRYCCEHGAHDLLKPLRWNKLKKRYIENEYDWIQLKSFSNKNNTKSKLKIVFSWKHWKLFANIYNHIINWKYFLQTLPLKKYRQLLSALLYAWFNLKTSTSSNEYFRSMQKCNPLFKSLTYDEENLKQWIFAQRFLWNLLRCSVVSEYASNFKKHFQEFQWRD